MPRLIPGDTIARWRKNMVGQKLRVTETFDTDTGELKAGDVGTVVSMDDYGVMKMNWLSGSKAPLVAGVDPYELAGCCSAVSPHVNTDGLDPEKRHWIRGVDRAKPIQWGFEPEDEDE
jgi:hypothetical protein